MTMQKLKVTVFCALPHSMALVPAAHPRVCFGGGVKAISRLKEVINRTLSFGQLSVFMFLSCAATVVVIIDAWVRMGTN